MRKWKLWNTPYLESFIYKFGSDTHSTLQAQTFTTGKIQRFDIYMELK